MGSVIPTSDHKLGELHFLTGSLILKLIPNIGAIDRHGEANINTASDFIAQYTTRQEYRYADALPAYDHDLMKSLRLSKSRQYDEV